MFWVDSDILFILGQMLIMTFCLLQASAGNSESMKDDLSGLDKAIGAILGQRTIERNQLLVSIAISKLNKVRDDKNEKVTKPEELVRLYDLLLQVITHHSYS